MIIDEAHALRNEDTTWYRAMERLLGGSRKEAVLLTATPINNGLWDLYNLVMLFARHDKAFAASGIDSVRDLFLAAGANERDPEGLDPDVLFPLADAVSVRRDRAFIEASTPASSSPTARPCVSQSRDLTTRRYDLDSAHPGLLDRIAHRDRRADYGPLPAQRLRPRGRGRAGSRDPARRAAALWSPQAL